MGKFINNLTKSFLAISIAIFCFSQDVIAAERLHVEGQYLSTPDNTPVQLRGVSFGWHMRYRQFYNYSVVKKLTDPTEKGGWGATYVRCSIGTNLDNDGFEVNPQLGFACADSVIQAAIKLDKYVMVDFHSHPNNLPVAKRFFDRISKKYGDCPNILYELWNEPIDTVTWDEVRNYASELIPVIRKNAPNCVIIVPTPAWDQFVHLAADRPLTQFKNLLYSVHFYAASHKDDFWKKALYALEKGLPVMFSECASVEYTGDGVIDMNSWDRWMDIANRYHISWAAWSLSDKQETSSLLRPGTNRDASIWTDQDLTPWALITRQYINKK